MERWRKLIDAWKNQIICILLGIFAFAAAKYLTGQGTTIVEGTLVRNGYGQSGTTYELLAGGIESKEIPVSVYVSPREYTGEEAEKVFKKIAQDMPLDLLKENHSLQDVSSDLNLPVWIEPYGVRVRWYSDNPELVNSYGQVFPDNISEGGEETFLTAVFSAGKYSAEYQWEVCVRPRKLSQEEETLYYLECLIKEADIQQQSEEHLILPQSFQGKNIYYKERKETNYSVFLLLGVAMAVLFYVRKQMNMKSLEQVRNRQMMLDYSEIVSKLLVYIGAGMTIRLAWEKIAGDYESRVGLGKKKIRYAYDEICRTRDHMMNGTPEGQAYMEFGRRCQLQAYLKLSGLLEQNRRTGTKNLRGILEAEMSAAFQERKNLAKRMGEEAGTKLLIPLFLMLAIVMVMIMVPAMLSFTM